MSEPSLNPCQEPGYVKDLTTDGPQPYCREALTEKASGTIDKKPLLENLTQTNGPDMSWLEDATQSFLGNGSSALCDPMQKGHIINEQGMEAPNRGTIYRYSPSIRGTDEGVKDLFRDIVVIDPDGKAHNVPIIWGTQEKAVAAILQENVRQDESLVVDRIRLPMMAIHPTSYQFADNRYIYHKAIDYLRDRKRNWAPGFTVNEKFERDTVFGVARGLPLDIGYSLYVWTKYEEDMNQIFEQVYTKFSRMAYIRVRGISWEVGVRLDSISRNVDNEPGDQAIRVFKHQFDLTAETFVAQPIVRKKAVLKTRVEVTDAPNEEDITEVLSRLEQAVKDLEG